MRETAPFVVGFGGSTSPTSMTSQLLHACLAQLEAEGARTRAFTGEVLARLPIFTTEGPPAASEFVEAVRAADAVVIATPGYHGAMSGLVKNALDHLEALRTD